MKRKFIVALSALFCSFFVQTIFLGSALFAYEGNLAAQFLCDLGRKMDLKGDIDGAVKEYSKVLLLDPDNPIALAYLRKQGMDQGLYQTPQPAQFPVVIYDDLPTDAALYEPPDLSIKNKGSFPLIKDQPIPQQDQIQELESQLIEEKERNRQLQSRFDEKSRALADTIEAMNSQLQNLIEPRDQK